MAFNHRKLPSTPTESDECSAFCDYSNYCSPHCVFYCSTTCPNNYPYIYPSPPPPLSGIRHISPIAFIIVAVLGGIVLLLSSYAIIVKYCLNSNTSRRSPPQSNNTQSDFLDENHGPAINHPIWFIATAGLRESFIKSITVCKYKKGGGLVEGTDCSVCLSEFQEDETLRLLPKCSHAFHMSCIDTWLRSHINCPLCRAPVVSATAGPPLTAVELNSINSGAGDEIQVENSVNDRGSGSTQSSGGGVGDMRVGTEDEGELGVEDGGKDIEIEKEGVPSSHATCELVVPSDLAEDHQRERTVDS